MNTKIEQDIARISDFGCGTHLWKPYISWYHTARELNILLKLGYFKDFELEVGLIEIGELRAMINTLNPDIIVVPSDYWKATDCDHSILLYNPERIRL